MSKSVEEVKEKEEKEKGRLGTGNSRGKLEIEDRGERER